MKKNTGFTLIELVVVMVILGLLVVTAIPKFVDLTDDAKQANIEGMAGGFATAVSLVRAQWETEGRPKNSSAKNSTSYDGSVFVLTDEDTAAGIRPGYVTGVDNNIADGLDVDDCLYIWENLYQQPPGITKQLTDLNNDALNKRYYAAITGTGANLSCSYHLKETLAKDTNTGDYTDTNINAVSNFFSYFPADSTVVVTIN